MFYAIIFFLIDRIQNAADAIRALDDVIRAKVAKDSFSALQFSATKVYVLPLLMFTTLTLQIETPM